MQTSEAPASEFRTELQHLINTHSREADSGTPDFILAQYLDACLAAFGRAVTARDTWYGHTTFASERTSVSGTVEP